MHEAPGAMQIPIVQSLAVGEKISLQLIPKTCGKPLVRSDG